MDPYSTHQVALIRTALETTGPILELGCGDHWHIEATFSNAVQPPKHGTFSDLEQCRAWLAMRYG